MTSNACYSTGCRDCQPTFKGRHTLKGRYLKSILAADLYPVTSRRSHDSTLSRLET